MTTKEQLAQSPSLQDELRRMQSGDRCVIGAGSVVVRDIPDDSLAVGNPARIVRKLNG